MIRDGIKDKYKNVAADTLKKNISSGEGIISKETIKDAVINNELVNEAVPVKQINEGLKQAEAIKDSVQSAISSVDNLSADSLLNNDLIKSQLPAADLDKAAFLKNNMTSGGFAGGAGQPLSNDMLMSNFDGGSETPVESVKKGQLKQQASEGASADAASQTGLYFSAQIGDLPLSTFDVVDFTLDEALSTLFTLSLTLSSKEPDIDLQQQLIQKAQFIVYSDGQKQRTVNGIVEKAERGDSGFKRTYYTFVVRPLLWQLTLTKDSRIYHFKSVPDIIDEILGDYSVNFDKQLMDPHPVREYVTMKRESYFEFISRLAAEEGITFWFEEDKMFYSDSHLGMTSGPELLYNAHPQSATKERVIHGLKFACAMRPTEAKVKDYRYTHPDVLMDAKSKANKELPAYEVYDSYGRYDDEQTAKQFSQYRLQALQSDSEAGQASSNTIQLMPGNIFQVQEHPAESMNNSWQVVRITHRGTLPQSLDNESDDGAASLTNDFSFIPGKNDWRPPFIHKPQADGDEIATVVGPAGEEIYVNEDGAVKIHFHWNRYDAPDENASCWVRVLQNWNGDGFGFLSIPRIGQEVLVGYVNGDIDRPIIMGTTYNGNNRPPLDLPAAKTQMSIKSKTHKGEGFNELRFEDEGGKQGVFLHAQKDMTTKVLNDRTTNVIANHTENVGANQTIAVKANQGTTVSAHHSLAVQGMSRTVVGATKEVIAKGQITIASATKIRLDCGAAAIEIDSAGNINFICENFNFFANVKGDIAATTLVDINNDAAKPAIGKADVASAVDSLLSESFPSE